MTTMSLERGMSVSGDGRGLQVETFAADSHPFDAPGFARGLQAAGYCEMLETSRKKIKTRFVHALNKENFKSHLHQFLKAKMLKARGEYMVRFVGQTDVHSPYVHLYTTSIPEDNLPIRIHPVESPDHVDHFSLWTHLHTIKGASHWSCKAKGPFRFLTFVLVTTES
ncbi:hypothetical protein MNV49_003146 [Pseudohyphozyma bogoriensis]|nr:hypothetical protein MNV49_003146 [Pseudohyphozyma bogoriensis]